MSLSSDKPRGLVFLSPLTSRAFLISFSMRYPPHYIRMLEYQYKYYGFYNLYFEFLSTRFQRYHFRHSHLRYQKRFLRNHPAKHNYRGLPLRFGHKAFPRANPRLFRQRIPTESSQELWCLEITLDAIQIYKFFNGKPLFPKRPGEIYQCDDQICLG